VSAELAHYNDKSSYSKLKNRHAVFKQWSQHATRNTQHATRNTQHATRNTQHAIIHIF